MEEKTPLPEPSIFERMRNRLTPEGVPSDDRGRMRMVMDNLILHIHPAKVEVTSMLGTGWSGGIVDDDTCPYWHRSVE